MSSEIEEQLLKFISTGAIVLTESLSNSALRHPLYEELANILQSEDFKSYMERPEDINNKMRAYNRFFPINHHFMSYFLRNMVLNTIPNVIKDICIGYFYSKLYDKLRQVKYIMSLSFTANDDISYHYHYMTSDGRFFIEDKELRNLIDDNKERQQITNMAKLKDIYYGKLNFKDLKDTLRQTQNIEENEGVTNRISNLESHMKDYFAGIKLFDIAVSMPHLFKVQPFKKAKWLTFQNCQITNYTRDFGSGIDQFHKFIYNNNKQPVTVVVMPFIDENVFEKYIKYFTVIHPIGESGAPVECDNDYSKYPYECYTFTSNDHRKQFLSEVKKLARDRKILTSEHKLHEGECMIINGQSLYKIYSNEITDTSNLIVEADIGFYKVSSLKNDENAAKVEKSLIKVRDLIWDSSAYQSQFELPYGTNYCFKNTFRDGNDMQTESDNERNMSIIENYMTLSYRDDPGYYINVLFSTDGLRHIILHVERFLNLSLNKNTAKKEDFFENVLNVYEPYHAQIKGTNNTFTMFESAQIANISRIFITDIVNNLGTKLHVYSPRLIEKYSLS